MPQPGRLKVGPGILLQMPIMSQHGYCNNVIPTVLPILISKTPVESKTRL